MLDPGKNKHHTQYDFLDDICIFPRSNDQKELVIKRISDDDYGSLNRSLNEKQGQSFYEALIRYLNTIEGENPDDVKVVKTVPTSKATFNIKGNILHAAFKIPAYCRLSGPLYLHVLAKA